jgi:hypothetical protein
VQLSAPPHTVCHEMARAISGSVFLFDLLVYPVCPATFAGTASGVRTLIDALLLASISCYTLTLRLDSFNHCSESLDLSAPYSDTPIMRIKGEKVKSVRSPTLPGNPSNRPGTQRGSGGKGREGWPGCGVRDNLQNAKFNATLLNAD